MSEANKQRESDSGSSHCYTVTQFADGSFQIMDAKGSERGRFRDAETLATHYAFAIEEADKMRALLTVALGMKERLPDEFAEAIDKTLNRCRTKISV